MRTAMLLLLTALVGSGCSDALGPSDLAGHYEATTLVDKSLPPNTDLLGLGVSLTVDLAEDGTFTGSFTSPDLAEVEDSPFDIDFSGRYTIDGETVRFTHDADTFLRDVDWTVADGQLIADTSELRVVLER